MKYEMPMMEIFVCPEEDIITTSKLTSAKTGSGGVVIFGNIEFE